jgi:hypothetical protein
MFPIATEKYLEHTAQLLEKLNRFAQWTENLLPSL